MMLRVVRFTLANYSYIIDWYLSLEFFLHHEGKFGRRVTPSPMLTRLQRNSTRHQKHRPMNPTTTLKILSTLLNMKPSN